MKQTKTEILKEVEKQINIYLKKEKKTILEVEKEWKNEEAENSWRHGKTTYPRIYSNQYYAFMELQSFWEELKTILNHI